MLSSIRPFSYSFSPEKIPETSQSLEIRAVSPALSYPPFILSSLRNFYSFPVPPGFFQKLPLSPLPRPNILFLSSHPNPPDAAPFVPLFVLKTPRLPRPHLAAGQSPPSLSHRLETVSSFSKIAAFSFFSGKTTKNLADSIEFFYSKFFQKAMLSPDNSWKSVVFSV